MTRETTKTVRTTPPQVIGKFAMSRIFKIDYRTVMKRVHDGRLPPPSPLSEIAGKEVWSVAALREHFAGGPLENLLTDQAILAAIRPLGAGCA